MLDKSKKLILLLLFITFFKIKPQEYIPEEYLNIINNYNNKHLSYAKANIRAGEIVEYLSNLKLIDDQENFWQIFQICAKYELIDVCHGLAREFIKKNNFLIPDYINDKVKEYILKQYFILTNNQEILKNTNVSLSFYDILISKNLTIENGTLNLSNYYLNNILDLNPGPINQLDLNNNLLKDIPEKLKEFDQLKNIFLSNNLFKNFPENLLLVKNLISIDLSNNKISKIPDSIEKLQNLWKLDLSNNNLKTLPENITNLKNLTILNLKNNPILYLPDKIIESKNIKALYSKNSLKEKKEISDKKYFVTACDKEYFGYLPHLIGSIHKTNFENLEEIAIFDLGLSQEQIDYLNKIEKVKIYKVELTNPDLLTPFLTNPNGKKVRGWFAWKPVVIKQALEKFPYILYIDAGTVILKNLDNLFKYIQEKDYFLLQDQVWAVKIDNNWVVKNFSIKDNANSFIIEKLNLTNNSLLDQPNLYAAVQGLTRNMLNNYILPVYELTKDLRYFQDDGSCPYGFGMGRHDQTVFSIQAQLASLELIPTHKKIYLNINDTFIPMLFADNKDEDPDIFYACKGQLEFANYIKYKN